MRCNDIIVGVFNSQSVDPGFISQVKSYQTALKNVITAQKKKCGEQACKLVCYVLWQEILQDDSIFMWQTGGWAKQSTHHGGLI